MGQTLVIAEKPSVAADIARALGGFKKNGDFWESDEMIIGAAVGHLLELKAPEAYDVKRGRWSFANLPVIPPYFELSPIKSSAKRYEALVKKIKSRKVTDLINACDAGREGELIFRYIVQASGSKKPIRRLWLKSMTRSAIRSAFQALRSDEDMKPLEMAARSRSEADWLVGINGTRALTAFNSKDGGFFLTTVGRVQTPTLAMVARRDYAVRHFVPKPYLAITANLAKEAEAFRAKWQPKPGQPGMDEEGKLLLDIPLGRSLVEKLAKEKTATVLSAETKRKRVYPPKVYSLADIQAEANRLYGFTAEETLAGCQALYEKHKVTSYPRTDSSYLPESQHAEAPGVLAAIAKTFPATARAVEKADPTLKSSVFNDKKVTAHHGIVPVAHSVNWSQLSDREQKLYRLIAKRYIAQFFPVHEYDETVVKLAIGDETFTARGRVVVVKGWKALYAKAEKIAPEKRTAKSRKGDEKKEEEDEDAAQTLPPLAQGAVVDVLSVDWREDQTKPPAYFTEGTLIAAMETIWKSFDDPHLQEKLKEAGGIGTPATRSVIIQELKRKKYLETEGKKLHCTEEGRKVLLTASPKVRSAVMTAQFEAKLQEIERGTTTLDAFVAEYEAFIRAELAEVTAKREGGKTDPKTVGAQGIVSEASVG